MTKKKYILDTKDKKRLYHIWWNTKIRCAGKQERYRRNYLLRGITICDEWNNDFMSFYEWATNNGYSSSLSIDRINNDKGYSPDNCRWATPKEQMNNVRYNLLLTYNDITRTASEWAEQLGLTKEAIYNRIKRGWPVEKIMETPLGKGNNAKGINQYTK